MSNAGHYNEILALEDLMLGRRKILHQKSFLFPLHSYILFTLN